MVQKLLERVAPERLAFVQAFKGSVYELSTHPYGCRVLQRDFEHIPEEQTRPLLDELHKYTINLMQDQTDDIVTVVPSFRAQLRKLNAERCGSRNRVSANKYAESEVRGAGTWLQLIRSCALSYPLFPNF